jgi:hypothetical protein
VRRACTTLSLTWGESPPSQCPCPSRVGAAESAPASR